jgi:hypothetical protein
MPFPVKGKPSHYFAQNSIISVKDRLHIGYRLVKNKGKIERRENSENVERK